MKEVKKKITWTKTIVRYLLIIGVINGTLPFILSAFDKNPASEMGIAWVTEIVAVALAYFVRGFKDTKEEENTRLREIEMGITQEEIEDEQ